MRPEHLSLLGSQPSSRCLQPPPLFAPSEGRTERAMGTGTPGSRRGTAGLLLGGGLFYPPPPPSSAPSAGISAGKSQIVFNDSHPPCSGSGAALDFSQLN